MAKVYLSVLTGADDGEATQYLERERVPFEVLPFSDDAFSGWLNELQSRADADDVAIVILYPARSPIRWSAIDVAEAERQASTVAAKRVILVRAATLDRLVRSNLSSVAQIVDVFSDINQLREKLHEHTADLRGLAPAPRPLPPPPLPSTTTAGAARSGVADNATEDDHLGFEPYVTAVAAFLTHANTPAPLTMSIEGPWGSGKSSFMAQLEKKLKHEKFLTVRFNAWRHEKAEELWAAFALHFLKGIKPRRRLDRWRAELRLSLKQFNFASGWPDLLRAGLWFLALAVASITLGSMAIAYRPSGIQWFARRHADSSLLDALTTWLGPTLGIGGWLAGAAGLVTLWKKFFAHVKSPLEIDLRKYLQRPDYESKLTFLEHFQQDLRDATGVYLADGKKVFVFIDDLDRCELPQAAELMRAINLMLSDSGPIVFVIGMDREKVAAALAVKHEKLLPYLSIEAPRKASDGEVADSLQGLFFGYGFIEKFIQIPFAIPEPSPTNIETLLASLRPAKIPKEEAAVPASTSGRAEGSAPTARPSNSVAEVARLHEFIRPLEEESEQFEKLVRLIAPALGNNPRRVKQFVNIFRLRVLIAFSTDLFVAPRNTPVEQRLTFEKLAKFTAIELRWPLLLTHLDSEPDLIAKLEQISLKRVGAVANSFRVAYWMSKSELMLLLKAGLDPNDAREGEWLLGTIDLARLTRVTVRQPRPLVNTDEETDLVSIEEPERSSPDVFDRQSLVDLVDLPSREPIKRNLGRGDHVITSPIVGTFFRSHGPEAPSLVEIGQRVTKGQVICIIEAMKLLNEIESDVDGVIIEIHPSNGHAVDYGEPLFDIRTDSRDPVWPKPLP